MDLNRSQVPAVPRRAFLSGLGAAMLSVRGAELLAQAAEKRLNVLFIMTDDHAAHAISAYGSRINKTPHIDALAQEGARLTNCCCTNPICAPSRAGILTGRYSHCNGVPTFNAISKDIKTVGGYLRDAGYYTAFLGKWHVGGPETLRDSDWDRWMVYSGQGVYWDPWFFEPKDGRIVKTVYKGEYATENLTRVTKEVISGALASGKPFFAMMHHKAPHRNWLPSEKYRAAFRKLTLKDIPLPDTVFDRFYGRASAIRSTAMTLEKHFRPGADLKLAEYFREGGVFEFEGRRWNGRKNGKGEYVDAWPEGITPRAKIALAYLRYMQDYLACVQSVDDSVGEMTAFLKEKGVLDDTLVIYTSDQGFFLGDHGLYDKRFIMEEVVKMPFLVRCPALVKPGSVITDLVSNIDFAPTFLALAGVATPSEMQGRSFLDNLAERPGAAKRDACYCRYYVEGGEHRTSAWYGIVTPTDKLVYYYKRNEWEYFRTATDPDELDNCYALPSCQSRIAALKKRLAELRAELGDDDRYSNVGEWVAKPD